MNKNIITFFTGYETKPLGVIEPFDRSLSHTMLPPQLDLEVSEKKHHKKKDHKAKSPCGPLRTLKTSELLVYNDIFTVNKSIILEKNRVKSSKNKVPQGDITKE
jgi:hypothetical protein